MKKTILLTLMTVFMLATTPGVAASSVEPPQTKSAEALQAQVLLNRLNEIKAMDQTELSYSDKRAVRKEVKAINRELKDIGGGVYVSAGAILLILILLIIFL